MIMLFEINVMIPLIIKKTPTTPLALPQLFRLDDQNMLMTNTDTDKTKKKLFDRICVSNSFWHVTLFW